MKNIRTKKSGKEIHFYAALLFKGYISSCG